MIHSLPSSPRKNSAALDLDIQDLQSQLGDIADRLTNLNSSVLAHVGRSRGPSLNTSDVSISCATSGQTQHSQEKSVCAPVHLQFVKRQLSSRRTRSEYLPAELFSEPAWDMLLDLYSAELMGQRVSVSSACIASNVPATTALRWLKNLEDYGLIVRKHDPLDGRRIFIELSVKGSDGMFAWVQSELSRPELKQTG